MSTSNEEPPNSQPSTTTEFLQEDNCYVALTHDHLDAKSIMDRVRSPEAGAIVLFAGTTRNSFDNKPVSNLKYSAYNPLALRSMLSIAKSVLQKHSLKGVAMIHRLGVVPVSEESILIAVSSPHRKAAWLAGEEALEECKARVEIWKLEEFAGEEGGVWRANRDGALGVKVAGMGTVAAAGGDGGRKVKSTDVQQGQEQEEGGGGMGGGEGGGKY